MTGIVEIRLVLGLTVRPSCDVDSHSYLTFSLNATAVLEVLSDGSLSLNADGASVVQDIANILEDSMGGTVGARKSKTFIFTHKHNTIFLLKFLRYS